MAPGPVAAWLRRRVRGVSAVLAKSASVAKRVAWAVGTVAVIFVFPLAMSIVEERVRVDVFDDAKESEE